MTAPNGDKPRRGKAVGLDRFRNVSAWVFDLDNTLYPAALAIFPQVEARMGDFIRDRLGVSAERASVLRKDFYERYGATLRGLILEHRIDADEFLEYVHDVDRSSLRPDPSLAAAIAGLPGKHFILTNGSRKHAEAVAARLGVADSFHDIFDIAWAGHLPKPSPETYDLLVRRTGVAPAKTAMFEDLGRNLMVPRRLGMATVLVAPQGTAALLSASLGPESEAEADFVTDDLAAFLLSVHSALGLAER